MFIEPFAVTLVRRLRCRGMATRHTTLRPTFAAFCPSRAMFESNAPVDKGSYSYGASERLQVPSGRREASEKAYLFDVAASRSYRLDFWVIVVKST